ncbi:transposase [Colletotrichum tofieldiae]|uniref:Transposase n=1 Tax=Colletotrichum tofieldiae TaxID=708197 RepID=A0A166N7G3_9PEZI|nr:transposase [Colletotrichum tofieldiae]
MNLTYLIALLHLALVSKEDFFPAFYKAFTQSLTEKNIQGGFKGSGIVPLSAEARRQVAQSNTSRIIFNSPTPLGFQNTKQPSRSKFSVNLNQRSNIQSSK